MTESSCWNSLNKHLGKNLVCTSAVRKLTLYIFDYLISPPRHPVYADVHLVVKSLTENLLLKI